MERPCALCGRERKLTFHHLIPRTLHSNKWFEKNFTKEEMRTRGIEVCRECHSAIHRFIPEKELGRNFNTLEKLLTHEALSRFVSWISKRA
jgi:hypothetical protein